MGVAWQLDVIDRWMESLSRDSLARFEHLLPREHPVTAVLLGAAALVLLLIFMRALSVLWAFGNFHGFRLTRRGDDLRAVYGLLPHVSKTIPRHRIQLLSTREGFLHRRCRRAAIQVETAGSAGQQEGAGTARLWLAPLVRKERVTGLIREVLPEIDLDEVRWQSLSARARGRIFRRTVYLAGLATAGAVGAFGMPGLVAPLLLVPLSWLHARLYVVHTAYALLPGAVLFRSGWWNRRLSAARFGKIQSVHWNESPFDRRHRMASLRVDTAGAARAGHAIDIPYLDAPVAARLQTRLSDEAGRTTFRW
jgi:putative membrane protein